MSHQTQESGDVSNRCFKSSNCEIIWGDACDALRSCVDDDSVDLLFADPPYNIGKSFGDFLDRWPSDAAYMDWCKKWIDLCIQKLSSTGTMYLMASTQAMPMIDLYTRQHLHVLSRIVWRYDSSGVQAKKYYGSMYEPILHCVRSRKDYTFNADSIKVAAKTGAERKLVDYRKKVPAPYSSEKVPGNVWHFPRVRYRMPEYEEHPSQKPESLLERIILASSNPGDMVLDPFAGTFTTAAVAKRLGRRTVGIELEREYVKIGLRRLEICDQLDGEPLVALQKSYVRKNGRGKSANKKERGKGLFVEP